MLCWPYDVYSVAEVIGPRSPLLLHKLARYAKYRVIPAASMKKIERKHLSRSQVYHLNN